MSMGVTWFTHSVPKVWANDRTRSFIEVTVVVAPTVVGVVMYVMEEEHAFR